MDMELKDFTGDLILLRGLPGSGKSTLASVILQWPSTEKPDVLSADDFFVDENGEYKFDIEKIKEAHYDCQNRCANKMRNSVSRIVVANTFTQEWEMRPYYEIAKLYNYRVHTLIVENRHGGINVHSCPEDKIKTMRKRFDIKL